MARKKRDLSLEVGEVVPAFDHASAVLAGRIMAAEALAARYGVEPPRLDDLAPMLLDMPPFVSRESVSAVLGMPLSSKTMRNHDCLGTGPRLRFSVANKVVYPAAFLLEWVERQNLLRALVAKPIAKVRAS